jgi:arabinofuranosyltransferase
MNWKTIIKQNKYFLVSMSLLLLIAVYLTWEIVIDDSYITYRYSYNLAKYLRICWNITDNPPVEGYSNPLWMFLNALVFALGINMVVFSKILSLISLIFIFVLFFMKFHENIFIFKLIVLIILIVPQTYIHINSGLETILYSFLMLLIFVKIYDILFLCKIDYYSIPVLCFLLTMLRPEGFIISAFSVLFYLIYSFKLHSNRIKVLSIFLIFLFLIIIFYIFRYNYFGYIFPNTYYVKVGSLSKGRIWIRDSIYLLLPLLFPILFSIFNKKNIRFIIFFLIFIFLSSISYMISDLMMDYSFRFLYHIFPIILFAIGIISNEYIKKYKHFRFSIITFSLIFCVFCWSQIDVVGLLAYGNNINEVYIKLGKRLHNLDIPIEYKTLCIGDAGSIPYYSEWNCIDFIGLNDLVIAHKLQKPEDYIFNKHSSVLFLYSNGGIELYKDQYGVNFKEILNEYEFIGSLKWNQYYYLMIYMNRDLPFETKEKIKKEIEISIISANNNIVESNDKEVYNYLINRLLSIFN